MGCSEFECESTQLVDYGQGNVKPDGLFTAMLVIDGVKVKVKIHVVPEKSQEVSLIVGHPYNKQEHVTIISNAKELIIQSDQHETCSCEAEWYQ